jgi:hypothetical protein
MSNESKGEDDRDEGEYSVVVESQVEPSSEFPYSEEAVEV